MDIKYLIAFINVWLNCFICLLVDVWKGVVWVLLILSILYIFLNSLLLNLVFWFVNICKGYLNLVKNLLIVVCVVIFVVCEGSGIYLIYLVNWFIIVNINEFFFGVVGNGFKKFRCICFIGFLVWNLVMLYCVCFVGFVLLL